MMANGRLNTACGVALVVFVATASAAAGDQAHLRADRTVATRGVPVTLEVTPICRLAGEDQDGQLRAAQFMNELCRAVGKTVADLEFPPDFSAWQGELKIIEHPAPPSDPSGGVRIVKPYHSLDMALMRSLLAADIPKLPNFRAACIIGVTVRRSRPE